jgi:hypothetical protein
MIDKKITDVDNLPLVFQDFLNICVVFQDFLNISVVLSPSFSKSETNVYISLNCHGVCDNGGFPHVLGKSYQMVI